jgi:hypothetical protein
LLLLLLPPAASPAKPLPWLLLLLLLAILPMLLTVAKLGDRCTALPTPLGYVIALALGVRRCPAAAATMFCQPPLLLPLAAAPAADLSLSLLLLLLLLLPSRPG